jgi:hypothetical protein
MAVNNYDILIQKLREFTRKYYINQLIRGGLYVLALLLISYLSIVLLENFGRFGTITRTGLFYTFIIIKILYRIIIIKLLFVNYII